MHLAERSWGIWVWHGEASTLGYGLEADYALSEKLSLRGQFNTLNYDDNFDKDGVNYTGSLDLSTLGFLVDWHPMGGAFRVTGGLYSNGNSISGVGTGEGTYTIGDQTYTVGKMTRFVRPQMSTWAAVSHLTSALAGAMRHQTKGGLLLSLISVYFIRDLPMPRWRSRGRQIMERSISRTILPCKLKYAMKNKIWKMICPASKHIQWFRWESAGASSLPCKEADPCAEQPLLCS